MLSWEVELAHFVFAFFPLLLAIYVYRDAKRRNWETKHALVWALASSVYIVGYLFFLLYLGLRNRDSRVI